MVQSKKTEKQLMKYIIYYTGTIILKKTTYLEYQKLQCD